MSKQNKQPKSPKMVKLSTVIAASLVIIGLGVSFIGGVLYANSYNQTIEAKALDKVQLIESKLNQ